MPVSRSSFVLQGCVRTLGIISDGAQGHSYARSTPKLIVDNTASAGDVLNSLNLMRFAKAIRLFTCSLARSWFDAAPPVDRFGSNAVFEHLNANVFLHNYGSLRCKD